MRPFTLQIVTWLTVAAAIGSAIWLATLESGRPFLVRDLTGLAPPDLKLPDQATSAGPPASQPIAPALWSH
jgi:hypothetical protein